MKLDSISNQVYVVAMNEARLQSHEYITPEHFLYAALMFDVGKDIIIECGGDPHGIVKDLCQFFESKVPQNGSAGPTESFALTNMMELALARVRGRSNECLSLGDILIAMFSLTESYAAFILNKNGVDETNLIWVVDDIGDLGAEPTVAEDVKQEKDESFLQSYTVNLTARAKKGLLDPMIGREEVLTRTIQILCRRLKNNPIHVGDPGVGKTAIVEGLAQRIVDGKVPKALQDCDIYSLDMGALVAGTRYRGDFEERIVKLLGIISKIKNPILYIDEIHSVVGAGAVSGGSMDATSIIKPYLAKGELKFIGSTTFEEYKKFFEKDRALSRRFQRIDVGEPTIEQCVDILKGVKSKYEKFHNVIYTDDVVERICELSSKYMNERYLPDKAIDVMDETGAAARMREPSQKRAGKRLDSQSGRSTYNKSFPRVITHKDIEKTVALMAKIPEDSLSGSEMENLRCLEENIKKQIFGQDAAVETVVSAIKASRSGLNEPNKPIASLLFVGPTGVGKTEIAKQLSLCLGIALERFDMSEYQEKHSVARLIGSPPGYVGYESGGLMTEAIRRKPNCVLLLDEIEKAHYDILNVLLQIMDYGTLTDNSGKKADFRHVILIMTSNAGASDLNRRLIGFEEKTNIGAIDKEIERVFSPEFRNRLDGVVTFRNVDDAMAVQISQKAFNSLADKLKAKKITLTASERLLRYIAKKGTSEEFGAREIMRVVENEVKKPMINEVLFGKLAHGGAAEADEREGKVVIEILAATGGELEKAGVATGK